MSQVLGPMSSYMINVSLFDTFVMQCDKSRGTEKICASDGRTLLKYCIDAAGRRTTIIQEKIPNRLKRKCTKVIHCTALLMISPKKVYTAMHRTTLYFTSCCYQDNALRVANCCTNNIESVTRRLESTSSRFPD